MMNLKKKICKGIFILLDKILPAYNRCRWGNSLKNIFAKRAFGHVGNQVNWGKKLILTSDLRIGDQSGVGDRAYIASKVTIGNHVMIGKDLKIFTSNHRTDRTDIPMQKQGFQAASPLMIGDDVWICDSVIITPGCLSYWYGLHFGCRSCCDRRCAGLCCRRRKPRPCDQVPETNRTIRMMILMSSGTPFMRWPRMKPAAAEASRACSKDISELCGFSAERAGWFPARSALLFCRSENRFGRRSIKNLKLFSNNPKLSLDKWHNLL